LFELRLQEIEVQILEGQKFLQQIPLLTELISTENGECDIVSAFGWDLKKVISRYAIYLNAGTLDWDFTVIVVNYLDELTAFLIVVQRMM
jgi:hypothetical protein